MLHFSIDKETAVGRDGRLLLMKLLEPLLGEELPYGPLLHSVHIYLASKRYKDVRDELEENMKRYLEEVSRRIGKA